MILKMILNRSTSICPKCGNYAEIPLYGNHYRCTTCGYEFD